MTEQNENHTRTSHNSSSAKTSKRRIIAFTCIGCQHEYEVPRQFGGRTVRCKKCDTYTVIPMVSEKQETGTQI